MRVACEVGSAAFWRAAAVTSQAWRHTRCVEPGGCIKHLQKQVACGVMAGGAQRAPAGMSGRLVLGRTCDCMTLGVCGQAIA